MFNIYLVNLNKYKEGKSTGGEWVELPIDNVDELLVKIGVSRFGSDGKIEHLYDYAIHEYDIDINVYSDNFELSEYENIYKLNEIAEKIESLDSYNLKVLNAIIEASGYDIQECLNILEVEDFIFYNDMSLKDVAMELIDDGYFGNVSETLSFYIDYESLKRDLSLDNYTETTEGTIILY